VHNTILVKAHLTFSCLGFFYDFAWVTQKYFTSESKVSNKEYLLTPEAVIQITLTEILQII
jgi:hypothetical protein